MKEKFTQGDWVNHGDDKDSEWGTIVINSKAANPLFEVSVLFDRHETDDYDGGHYIEEATANANLIAAAPEMYRMLKEQSKLLIMLNPYTHDLMELDAPAHDIDMLLAKARGESDGN